MELGNREFGVVFDENGILVRLLLPTEDFPVPQVMLDIAEHILGIDPSEFEEESPTIH